MSTNGQKVSVIVPIYNVENYLIECVESILNQSYADIEVILIDDGSDDSSGLIADEFAKLDSRVRVIHIENSGVSFSRNLGLKESTGKYVTFVDADDAVAPSFVENLLKLATENSADYVVSYNVLDTPNQNRSSSSRGRVVSKSRVISDLLYPRVTIGSWNKLYLRQMIVGNNISFSTKLFSGEGQLFILTCAQHSSKTIITEQTDYFYRRNRPGSAVTAETLEKWLNGLDSVSLIRENMTVQTNEVLKALDFYEWETRLLLFKFLVKQGLKHNNYLAESCIDFNRHKSIKLALFGRLPFSYRLKLILSFISPKLFARIQIYVEQQRKLN